MELELLTPEAWLKERRRFIEFAVRFGEKRITVFSLHAMRRLNADALRCAGDGFSSSAAAAVRIGGRLAGIGFASGGGEDGCIVVVHPEARQRGVGSAILSALTERMNGLTCNAAADNYASMALCFSLGMHAVSLHKGPTGKPTLRFERRIRHDSARAGHTDPIPE